MRHALYAIAALASAAAGASLACAQPQPPQNPRQTPAGIESRAAADSPTDPTAGLNLPAGARRVTNRFAFEPIPGDATGLPPNWIRAQHDPPIRDRPGFPIWNRGVIDDQIAFAGTGSVRLDTEGGSASLLLDPGLVQVFPDADYAVVARVRTKDVIHARARLAARLLDRAGNPIEGSEVSSAPIRTRGEWSHISVRVPGDHAGSISLQIELLLEQPGPDPDHPYQPFEIERQDYQGSAWFDELAVIQIPRVEAWVDEPGNLVPAEQRPAVNLFVRDLVNEPLEIRCEIDDARGVPVDARSIAFNGGRLEETWQPGLDRFGYYSVRVAVLREGVPIGEADTAFVWAPPRSVGSARPSARDASPFSLSVARVPNKGLPALAETALAVRAPRVLTSLYEKKGDPGPDRVRALAELANALAGEGSELGLAVDALPDSVSAIGGAGPVVRALADPDADGAAWLEPILVDLGHRVRWWRAGAFGESLDTRAARDLAAAAERLRELVPGGVIEVPVSAFDAVGPASVGPGIAIAQPIDPAVLPDEVPNLTDTFVRAIETAGITGWNRPEYTGVFAAPAMETPTVAGSLAPIHEAVLNAVHAWAGFGRGAHADPSRARSLRLDGGWSWHEGRRPQLVPEPIAAAWIPLIDALTGRDATPLGRVAPGVRGVLLTPRQTAGERTEPIAVFWAVPAPEPRRYLSLLLGPERVTAADVFGNRTPIEATTLPNSGVRAHTVDLSDGPVFVEGVDPELLRFLASVRAEPSLVQSNTEADEVELVFENPWDSPVQGDYFLVEPGNLSSGSRAEQDRRWDISPRFGSFAIAGGDTARLPVVFDVSPAIPAGPAEMVVDLDLAAPTVSDAVRVERTIGVGLENIAMHLVPSYAPEPWGPDLVVYAVIENSGVETENITLSVSAPGYNRQRAASSPVFPGRRTIKVFPFRDGRSLLAGQTVTAGLQIRERGSRLLRSVTIDDGSD